MRTAPSLPGPTGRVLTSVLIGLLALAVVLGLAATPAVAADRPDDRPDDRSDQAQVSRTTGLVDPDTVPVGPIDLDLGPLLPLGDGVDDPSTDAEPERRDAPFMPDECFAPAQTNVDPGPCYLTPFRGNRPTLVVWGDSHAYQYVPALRDAVRRRNVNLVSFVAGSCPPVALARGRVVREGYNGKCERNNDLALDFVARRMAKRAPVSVLLGSNWSGFRRAWDDLSHHRARARTYSAYTKQMVRLSHHGTPRLFTTLGRLGTQVDVVAQSGTVPSDARACAAGDDPYLCNVPRRDSILDEAKTRTWLVKQARKLSGSPHTIDATGAYCNRRVCHGRQQGVATWFDALHLSATLTHTMSGFFASVVGRLHRR